MQFHRGGKFHDTSVEGKRVTRGMHRRDAIPARMAERHDLGYAVGHRQPPREGTRRSQRIVTKG